MELNKIAPTQRIAWWNGASLKIFQANGEGIIEVCDTASNTYTTLVLPGNAFSRRFHPKPFNNKDKLKKILPTFLSESLFAGDNNNESIATVALSKTPTFSSFSIKNDVLNDFVHKTGAQTTPVVETLPLPAGLSFYAPKNKTSIVIAKVNNEVVAGLVGDMGEIKDYRCLPENKWKKEANLTICGWKNNDNIEIYSIGCVFVPQNLEKNSVKLSHSVSEDLAVLNGIVQNFKNIPVSTIPTSDITTENNKKSFYKNLIIPFGLASIFTLVALGNVWLSGYMLENTLNEIEAEKSTIFENILPNTPQVDVVAQISRRLSELSYASGEKIMLTAPITEQITALQEKLSESKTTIQISEISLTSGGFKLRGSLTTLSDVEKVKQALSFATGGVVTLHNAQLIQGKGVDFYMESKK